MASKKAPKGLLLLLKRSIDTYWNAPIILAPFVTIAFVQLLALEILYFSPRFPLAGFFNPIIGTLWGGKFIHYPANIALLPKLFQNIQVPIYIFLTSYFVAVAIHIISELNNGKRGNFGYSCKEVLRQYIHIFVGALISFATYFGLYKAYAASVQGIVKSSQVDGVFFIIKKLVLIGSPYINLLIGVFVTSLFAFVFPAIVIDKKKILAALGANFKSLFGSFWYVVAIVLVPTLFFIPVILLRSHIGILANATVPEMRILALVVSVLFTLFIDATIYTAVTLYYLLKREHS